MTPSPTRQSDLAGAPADGLPRLSRLVSPTRRVLVVAPRGELTVADCSALRAALRCEDDEPVLLVVDLRDVPTMDEAVVEVLVGASARCGTDGRAFVVANANAQPWTVLTRARVAGVVRLHRRGAAPLTEVLQLLEA